MAEAKMTVTIELQGINNKAAFQSINMTNEAYTYMTSTEVPSFATKSHWSRMNKRERLTAHCKEIAKLLQGKFKGYTVYPD